MPTNPCRACLLRDADKNNPRCLDCRARLAYLRRLALALEFSACHPAEHVYHLNLPRS